MVNQPLAYDDPKHYLLLTVPLYVVVVIILLIKQQTNFLFLVACLYGLFIFVFFNAD